MPAPSEPRRGDQCHILRQGVNGHRRDASTQHMTSGIRYMASGILESPMRKLSLLMLAAVTSAVGAQSQNRELLPEEQVQQVLSRLTFGARPGDAEKVRAIGI